MVGLVSAEAVVLLIQSSVQKMKNCVIKYLVLCSKVNYDSRGAFQGEKSVLPFANGELTIITTLNIKLILSQVLDHFCINSVTIAMCLIDILKYPTPLTFKTF